MVGPVVVDGVHVPAQKACAGSLPAVVRGVRLSVHAVFGPRSAVPLARPTGPGTDTT